jgi:hypothetical protein
MPTRVFRRTPASEKAAMYGYKDLLKDSLLLLQEKATANVERMTSGGLSDEELLEIGLAPAGGMLKVAGTSRLLAGLLAQQARAIKTGMLQRSRSVVEPEVAKALQPGRRIFKEALKVPEKEYGRIRDINWSSMKGEALGTKGLYFPIEKDIALNPYTAGIETIWHEFTHARQQTPEKGEATSTGVLRFLNEELARRSGLSGRRDFYYNISPMEKHARNVGRSMAKGGSPGKFNFAYKMLLDLAIAEGEKRVGPELAKDFWDTALKLGRK